MQAYTPPIGNQPIATKAIAKMGENWVNWAGAKRYAKSPIRPIRRFTGMTTRPR